MTRPSRQAARPLGYRALVAAVIIAASLTAMLISALAVQAGKQYYEGSVADAKGEITFVLKRQDGDRLIRNFHGDTVVWICGGLPGSLSFDIEKIKVNRKGRFHIEKRGASSSLHAGEEIYPTPFSSSQRALPPPRIDVTGRFRQGGRASGTVRVTQPSFEGGTLCDSGTMEWKAST